MTKKNQIKQSSQKPKDDLYKITCRTPAWMREFLADHGLEGEFSLSNLSKEQWLAIDLAERLCQQEMNGLTHVTYNPDVNSKPQVELTEHGINARINRQGNAYGEDTKTPSEETLP